MGEAQQVREVVDEKLFRLDASKTALLVIDMQNAFLEKGAAFEIPGGRKVIPNIEKIIKRCREAGIPIIWTQSDHSPPYGGLVIKKYPVIAKEKVLWKSHPSFELYSNMLQPLPSEYRVIKHKYDAFYQTDLEMILRNLRIEMITITGVDTCVCCESTARAAFFRDFYVAFVSDGTASYDSSYHESALKRMSDLFGRVMTTKQVLAEL